MEVSETLKILNDMHDQCCEADNILCTDVTGARCEALEAAMDAVEKQIPRKAVGNHSAYMRCPTCNHTIPSGGSGRNIRRRESWCDHCGQKIDWDRKELN